MNEKVLVVEDEKHIRDFITLNLSLSKFQVIEASSGEEGLIKYEAEKPDVVILDILLPNIDGYEVCKRLRGMCCDCCIIMLTAKAQDMDKIIGLDIGADDYMVKPFNPMELISRINANLRKIKRNNLNSDVLIYRQLKLNKSSQKFYKNHLEIEFTFREFSLIEVFMESINKALSREKLLDLAWGEDFFGEIKTVDVHVRRIREKIEDNPSKPIYIQTVWGVGYRFGK
ncbi:response regulator transcription factor [Clostridium tagluense]|uniref:response regulator transcription factor n=1 Tax=Clostridium tagluense TaxID=360422 RepID=UPI001CF56BC1|nr:response regulator transcription factor [Clostridium tagluense]MCB2310333.1 response regulator transcription factor [Clostridium tagluense]MCB2315025.1 response regulator transcription factor [Clostridium tagluense]MCB2320033.1 response regulator transcription factor [Clostridium tagluense]MCB2324768.1 response regulator transcription factor [Clostridium tagluense]MCB2329778.1 response regulator transcription factor [Clostridium tagluense]